MILVLILLFIVLTIGAVVRKFIGFGDAVFVTPILIIFLEQISLVTPLIGLTTLLMGIIVFWFDGSAFKINKEVIIFFTISLVGLFLGSFLLNNRFGIWLKLGLAIFVLLVCIQNLFTQNKNFEISKILKSLLAFISGLFSILFNMPGPTTALYFSNFKKREFRATLSVYFLIIEPLSSIGHYSQGLLTSDIFLLFVFLGIPACLIGVLLSLHLADKLEIPQRIFQKRINQFLILVALLIIIQVGLESFSISFDSISLAGSLPNVKEINVGFYVGALSIYTLFIFLILKKKNHNRVNKS